MSCHAHTHRVCYSDYRRDGAPSVDRGLVLQPGYAAAGGGAGAAWAGSSPASQLHPFCRGSSRTTNTHRRDGCTPPPWTQSPCVVGGRRLVTPRKSRTASTVFLHRSASQPRARPLWGRGFKTTIHMIIMLYSKPILHFLFIFCPLMTQKTKSHVCM